MGIYVHLKKQNVVNVIVTNACMYNLVLKNYIQYMYFSYFVCLHHYMHYAFCIVSLCNNDARHLSLEYSEDSFGFHHEV